VITVAAVFEAHVQSHTVVLPRQRVLFLPMPKAACTSILWTLAELAGLTPAAFENSTLPEPSAALTVHDMNAWPADSRLSDEALTEDGWLRFTVVRDPWTRLWSAWVSKLLLREPRFVTAHGEHEWFPRVPERADDVVEDFRRFVRAVGAGQAVDVHWCVQHDLSSQLPLNHVGRTERLDETLTLLGTELAPARRNASPLPLPPDVYDDELADIVRRHYAADFAAFAYERTPPAGEKTDWSMLPLLAGIVDEHERTGQLHRLAQRRAERMQSAESRLAARRNPPAAVNLEGEADFNVRWGWDEGPVHGGMTAIVRVKDEARALPFTLPPLLRAVDRVVLVDNGSTDGSAAVACEVAEATGAAPLDIARYPFAVARCGSEHVATPEASVHSLAYFYNWSFAHVRSRYALKWDGDMVLSDFAVAALRDLAWQLEAADAVVRVPRLGLYVASDELAYVDTALRNCEPWAWPNRPGYRFVKAFEWELPMFPPGVDTITLPDFACVELKFLDDDEFGHWSPTDFEASPRTARKRREQDVFRALVAGAAPPDGVIAVRAPSGVHVIDHVRTRWLSAAARSGAALQAVEPVREPRLHAGHAR
jgi:sulfotransferase famil protein